MRFLTIFCQIRSLNYGRGCRLQRKVLGNSFANLDFRKGYRIYSAKEYYS